MDKARKYTVNFENLSGFKLRALKESLTEYLHKTINEDRYDLDFDFKVKSIEELLEIIQPVWDNYNAFQKGRNDEYELYLKLKAKFEDCEKSAKDEPPKELRRHNWRDSFIFG